MNTDITEVVEKIVTHHGAVVERTGNGCLEYICPESLAKDLEIPEEGTLVFQYDHTCDKPVHASYDSEMFQNLERLFQKHGRIAAVQHVPSYTIRQDKIAKSLYEHIGFSNATFRLDRTEILNVVYLLVFFKYTAISDEIKEGMLSLLINRYNLSITSVRDETDSIMADLHEMKRLPRRVEEETVKAVRNSFSAASLLVQDMTVDFIKSLNRRLNREIKRINEYYETLKDETRIAIRNKALLKEEYITQYHKNPREFEAILAKGIEDRTLEAEGTSQLYDKLDAIEIERKWKEQDLQEKFALKVQIDPVTTLHIESRTPVFSIILKKSKATRRFPVTYNLLLNRFDHLPCESCFYPQSPWYVCDDKLHIICSRCFPPCPKCGKNYCMACHKEGCPKCT